jgi:nucleoside-diphosphate-sugar epimerase
VRAFITGITGFAGQYLAEHLVDCGDQVLGTTWGDTWSRDVAPALQAQIRLIPWDLTQPVPAALRAVLEAWPVDWVFHLAAISVPGECGGHDPSPLAQAVNVAGTRAVLELAGQLRPAPRVLVVSSAHVYAPVDPARPQVAEDAPLAPRSAYGVTKLACERLCAAAVAGGLDAIVARAFQHAGPRQLPKFMLPEWAAQFAHLGDEPIRVVTLDSYNDLSDVRDVVRAYRHLLDAPHTRGVYNVGSGINVRSGDVFALLAACSGRHPDVVQLQPGRRQSPIADISRITAATGWSPRIPLRQTVGDTWAYFQSR